MPIFSGLASISHSETRKPSNFPPGTPNVHFDGLSLISYLLKLAKVSARSVSRSEPLHDLTTMSSIYVSTFRVTDLSEQALLNHAHECGTNILEAKGHINIAEKPERGDESCLYLIGSIQ